VQAYISRARIESFSLIADLNYVSQNAPRICRALFEICLRKGWYVVADQLLTFSKVSLPTFKGRRVLHTPQGQVPTISIGLSLWFASML
jgi:hypothetical protein